MSRGGMSSRNSDGLDGDSCSKASTGSAKLGLTPRDDLYRTFTPSNAGWSLQDFAWDKQAHRVASREVIAAEHRERNARVHYQNPDILPRAMLPNLSLSSSWGNRPRRPSGIKLLSRVRRKSETRLSSRRPRRVSVDGVELASLSSDDWRTDSAGGGERIKTISRTKDAIGDTATPYSRRCLSTGCDKMCRPSSRRRVERVLCEEHSAMRDVLVENDLHRFCQVCYALHPTSAFRSRNRTCNAVLGRKRAIRIQCLKRLETTRPRAPSLDEVLPPRDVPVKESKKRVVAEKANARERAAREREKKDLDATNASKGEGNESTTESDDETVGLREGRRSLDEPYERDVKDEAPLPDRAHERAQHPAYGGSGSSWVWSSVGVSLKEFPANPSAKRSRLAGPRGFDEIAQSQIFLDTEHGALGGGTITSAAIKVPHATPEFFSRAAGGSSRGSGGHAESEDGNAALEHRGHPAFSWRRDSVSFSSKGFRHEPKGGDDSSASLVTRATEHEINSLIR